MQPEKLPIKRKNISRHLQIKTGKIHFYNLLAVVVCISSLKSFAGFNPDDDMYDLSANIRDAYFEIHSDKLKTLVESKISLKVIEKIYFKLFWFNKKSFVEIVSDYKLDTNIEEEVKISLQHKIELIFDSPFSKFTEGYTYQGLKDGWHHWEDPTGLKDIGLVLIKKSKNKMTIVQKKPTGTVRVVYHLIETKWSKPKQVIDRVVYKAFEGIQSLNVNNKIDYHMIDGHWLPKTLTSETKQRLTQLSSNKKDNSFEREIKESYHFKNYKINQAEALKFFSKR